MRFAQSRNTRFKGTKISVSEFSVLPNLPHFGSVKMRFQPIRESIVWRYLAKSGNSLNFWAWKCVLPCCEIHVARIPSFELSNFPHVSSIVWKNFPHFSSL